MSGERRSAAERKKDRLKALLHLAEQDTDAARLLGELTDRPTDGPRPGSVGGLVVESIERHLKRVAGTVCIAGWGETRTNPTHGYYFVAPFQATP